VQLLTHALEVYLQGHAADLVLTNAGKNGLAEDEMRFAKAAALEYRCRPQPSIAVDDLILVVPHPCALHVGTMCQQGKHFFRALGVLERERSRKREGD
jgi:hypothetical protein